METAHQLKIAFQNFAADTNALVAVLYGEGGTFCAGYDLQEIAAGNITELSIHDGPMGPTKMELSKPVVAAINGYAVAGGLELALWCDLRIMEETAILGAFCRRFGVPLIDGGTVRLPALIGLSRSLDLILTGRGVSAKEAFEMGLVTKVCKKGEDGMLWPPYAPSNIP
ncbi:putative enoyl-CoA hydratase/isomerase YngF isoform X2 [Stegodyphus dumicola]|uniref:putative enoyl-CoA hydratase/isomerase YngF isoform X2 n=1 Tax=Stegodyphus dumicola TaxID=202533 RepID=UPI0015AA799B|nr:putative enoyl-CoA hydratase/isomerase YngF isoform X2 [Stegodyphus dumicola]